MVDYLAPDARKHVIAWLYAIAAMVLCMVIIGGLTRLTGSGLSMVDWKPLMGAVPPMNTEAWQEVFDKYKQFPEYQLRNSGMTLTEFKFIFFMEYFHRLFGRLIGLVFIIPFVWFLFKKWLYRPMILRGLLLFFLGGLQGFMGWYMVKSGLIDVPRVSQYRLVMHLFLALLVYTLCLWYAFGLQQGSRPSAEPPPNRARIWLIALLAMIGFQIASGGLVAGLDAGIGFNTWPTMNGEWFPPGLWNFSPWYLNFLENPVMVQLSHRNTAYVLACVILFFYIRYRSLADARLGPVLHGLPVLLALQVLLGIGTLLLRVPVSLASLHQIGAIALWTLVLYLFSRTTAR